MKKATYSYFCDCCGKQVETEEDLKRIGIVCTDDYYRYGGDSEFKNANYVSDFKDVCIDCKQQFRSIYDDFVTNMRTKFNFKGQNNKKIDV